MNIKVKMTKSVNANAYGIATGSIKTLDMEEYLRYVVPNEMSDYYPAAALRAQAIAARTFAMYRIDHPRSSSFDLYDNTDDQSFEYVTQGATADAAISASSGLVLSSSGNVF